MIIGKAVAARKKRRKGGKTGTVVVDAQALWGMLYADDAGIVSRSPDSLEKMMAVIVHVAGLFGLMVSEPKMEMCLLPKGTEECQFTVNAGDQTYKQTDRAVYLGRTITAGGKADKEIASRICRAWRCFRRHSEAMYDRRVRRSPAQGATTPGRGGGEAPLRVRLVEPDGGPLHQAQRGSPPVPHAVHRLENVETYGPPPVLR